MSLLAAIPYRTLPDFQIGPVTVRSFGLLVALGIVLGTVIGARYVANRGMDPEHYTGLATRAVIGGLIGARLFWVVSHLDQIGSPIDVIAVWDGGMQFSGGLLMGAVVGWLSARGHYSRTQRWHLLDGSAVGLTAGLAIGRIGCLAVGEHFGGESNFFLAMTYQGGGTIEPLQVGQTIHNTALYELLHLAVLGAIYAVLLRRAGDRGRPWPLGMLGGIFFVWYGAFRFLTDTVRIYDARLAGLTGAQWAGVALVLVGLLVLATMGNRTLGDGRRQIVSTGARPKSAVRVLAADEVGAAAPKAMEASATEADQAATPSVAVEAGARDASADIGQATAHDATNESPAGTQSTTSPGTTAAEAEAAPSQVEGEPAAVEADEGLVGDDGQAANPKGTA